jgi:hypothetical protein
MGKLCGVNYKGRVKCVCNLFHQSILQALRTASTIASTGSPISLLTHTLVATILTVGDAERVFWTRVHPVTFSEQKVCLELKMEELRMQTGRF